MKVQELRKLLSAADRALLEKAFVESYKQFSKSKKELEIDPLIIDILSGEIMENSKSKISGEKNEFADFDSFEYEVQTFLENAYAQNYYVPNRIIPKNQRSKWRFMVKKYIKYIENLRPDMPYYQRGTKLLWELYTMLCYACNYYLFSSDDPFRSIGWEQPDLFRLLAERVLGVPYSEKELSGLLITAASGGLSREALHEMQMNILVRALKTPNEKYAALEETQRLVAAWDQKNDDKKTSSLDAYERKEGKNNLCGLVLLLSVSLNESKKGIEYYFKYSKELSKEIVLYCALNLISWFNDDDRTWIDVYRYGLKQKIKPREELQQEYAQRQANLS